MNLEEKIVKHILEKKLTGKYKLIDLVEKCVNRYAGVSVDSLALVNGLAEKDIVSSVYFDNDVPMIDIRPLRKTKTQEDLLEKSGEVNVDEPIPADNLKDLVKGSQYSQKELANRLGVSKSTIYRATKNPEKYEGVVSDICELLGVDKITANTVSEEAVTTEEQTPENEEPTLEYNLEEIEGIVEENKGLKTIILSVTAAITKFFKEVNLLTDGDSEKEE
jgi:transcriptional regulator with XRE-family HTH domain